MDNLAGYQKLIGAVLQTEANDILPLRDVDCTIIDRAIQAAGNQCYRILSRRFGLHGERQKLKEIAKVFELSSERIRQLEAEALSKLRHPHRIKNFLGFTETGLERLKRTKKTPLLETDVKYFEPSTRTLNALDVAGVRTLGELVRKTEREMLRIPNFGRKSLAELKNLLLGLGLDFAQP